MRTAVLVRLDDELAAFSAEQPRTVWDIARADLEVLSSLYERGNASRIDLERAGSSEQGARAAYEQNLKILQDRTIKSPIDGRIVWIDENASPGNYVNAGTLLALVVDVSGFTLMLELGEQQIGLVGRGRNTRGRCRGYTLLRYCGCRGRRQQRISCCLSGRCFFSRGSGFRDKTWNGSPGGPGDKHGEACSPCTKRCASEG
ncbi:HlyD family efflux transporter periplasmic adaptor subunit [Marispirochaeta sp.]|uniref:efflux RND transporter periplasmic adaptor subunit n=1 Tax=Marispirochaeta sp. TaxID=2038653 RepID=UPI0029C83FA1|nr:HlyD family efflux transporter periplasmic adaptor subunit [Marispirochaeta sp.]